MQRRGPGRLPRHVVPDGRAARRRDSAIETVGAGDGRDRLTVVFERATVEFGGDEERVALGNLVGVDDEVDAGECDVSAFALAGLRSKAVERAVSAVHRAGRRRGFTSFRRFVCSRLRSGRLVP